MFRDLWNSTECVSVRFSQYVQLGAVGRFPTASSCNVSKCFINFPYLPHSAGQLVNSQEITFQQMLSNEEHPCKSELTIAWLGLDCCGPGFGFLTGLASGCQKSATAGRFSPAVLVTHPPPPSTKSPPRNNPTAPAAEGLCQQLLAADFLPTALGLESVSWTRCPCVLIAKRRHCHNSSTHNLQASLNKVGGLRRTKCSR